MKSKVVFLMLMLAGLFLASCSDDDTVSVTFSQTEFETIPAGGTILTANIEATGRWTASSQDPDWCYVYPSEGNGNGTIRIEVMGNLDEERTGTIVISSGGEQTEIHVTQSALGEGEELHYRLPVIFHVLYKDRTDPQQYITPERIHEVLENVNQFYQGEVRYSGGDAGQNINLEFYLAEADEEGNVLENAGIEYVQWDEMPIECTEFMASENENVINLMWDQNRYINIVLYNFAAESGSGSVTLGISHLPYSTQGSNYLEGLSEIEYTYIEKEQLQYPHCVSINSLYFDRNTTSEYYDAADVYVTLAHELGHYLGLHHAFNETEEGELATDCIDSDYCDDTPPYDRNIYSLMYAALSEQAALEHRSVSFDEVVTRINCLTGQEFISYNMMDYEVSCSDRFTSEQRDRIRHVLRYSPLIPGPKDVVKTRSLAAKLDLPIVYRK